MQYISRKNQCLDYNQETKPNTNNKRPARDRRFFITLNVAVEKWHTIVMEFTTLRNMNKVFCLCAWFLLLNAFVCGRKGETIFFINQNEDHILICDTLDNVGYLKIYDTLNVNGQSQVRSKGNYVPKFSLWETLLPNAEIDLLRKNKIDKIKYLFIRNDNIGLSKARILSEKLYDSLEIGLKEILNNDLNYIIYYKDSITFVHEFNLTHGK